MHLSKSSKASKSSVKSKSSTHQLNSPPAIRIKPTDRLAELENLANQSKSKKNIQVVSKKKSNLSSKFGEIDSYFDSIMK